MKKTMMIIALFVVLVFTVSFRPDRDYRASLGYEAPELSLRSAADSSAVVDLASMRGRFVMVNFWAAFDAESRIAAHDFDRMAAEIDTEQLCLLQVNLDSSERLFREIVRRDRLNAAQQFTISAQEAKSIEQAFNLGSGLQSYLIDPSGKIVAVNPTPSTVAQILAS